MPMAFRASRARNTLCLDFPGRSPYPGGVRALVISLFLLAASRPAGGQGFGQNHVIRDDFDWKVVSTEHFDIHYYAGSAARVPFAAQVLERSYARLSRELGVDLKGRKPFFLYASVDDMQQSNIARVGDGTGGVTEAFKFRFMAYNDGSLRWLDTVATHELAHVFQYHVLTEGFWRSGKILKTIVYPLWMMEGMAELFSWGTDDPPGEVVVRDAATSGTLIPLWKLERFSHLKPHQVRPAYETGGAALEFLESQYGEGRAARMLRMFESRFETSALLKELIGTDIFGLESRWREYAEEKYGRIARRERLREPGDYGPSLTGEVGRIPVFNASPAFSPDGRRMAFLSTRDGHPPSVMLKDLDTGRTRRLLSGDTRLEDVPFGNFAQLSRAVAFSRDGAHLAFAARKNNRHSLYVYDLRRGRLRRIKLPGFQWAAQPAFAPDGRSLAFAGMKGSITDIYRVDLASEELRQLTSDPQDDQSPAFSPDGRSLVYSSEVEVPGDPMPYQRRLYRLDLKDLSAERLSDVRGAAHDPVFSPDGERLLFSLERDDWHEACELQLSSRRVYRLTRSLGAAYTPSYSGQEVAFAAYRRGNVHVHRAPRARLEAEPVPPSGAGYGSTASPFEEAPSTAAAKAGPPRPYEPSYSTDLFLPALFYASNGGLFWTSYWQGSDLLGNHGAQALVSYASGRGLLNYQTRYEYSRWRPQLGVGAAGYKIPDNRDGDTSRRVDESSHAQFGTLSYPLDRFHRIDLIAGSVSERRMFRDTGERDDEDARIGSAALVRDTVRGRYLVATRGSRLRLAAFTSHRDFRGKNDYQTYLGEAHQYLPLGEMSALALRAQAAQSIGRGTPQHLVGGIGRVRGYARSTTEDFGSRSAIATAELRFPLLRDIDYYMWWFFPDFYFKAVTAAVFTDAGYVWDRGGQLNRSRWGDVRHSFGGGLRLHTFVLQLFPLFIHFDYARRTTSKGGVFYVYLGPVF